MTSSTISSSTATEIRHDRPDEFGLAEEVTGGAEPNPLVTALLAHDLHPGLQDADQQRRPLTSRRTLDTELESRRVNHHPHGSMTTCECLLWTSTFWTEHEHFDAGEEVR